MTLKEHLKENFVYIDDVADILEIGYVTGKNVFLYGRGGHAKSEIIEHFLRHVDQGGTESFIQACGEGLTEDKLFGGIDMKKFQKTGEIEHLVENSFMNKKYVVFEELLDSRMSVLLSLKDILTSGVFRQGKQQFKIRTEFIICLTNRTKQEVSEDNSVKALLERFPLEMKVEWPRYERTDYSAMFQKVLKDDFHEVAQICHLINDTGDFVSPRTAIHMAQVYQATGNLLDLKYFGASSDIIEKMEKEKREQDIIKKLAENRHTFDTIIGSVDDNDSQSLKKSINSLKELEILISATTYPDTIFSTYTKLQNDIEVYSKSYRESLLNIFMNE